jgi:hypothetical protein
LFAAAATTERDIEPMREQLAEGSAEAAVEAAVEPGLRFQRTGEASTRAAVDLSCMTSSNRGRSLAR